MFSIKLSRDKNGNKTVKIIPLHGHSFSIQTLGNLPKCHTLTVESELQHTLQAFDEVKNFVKLYGTAKQKAAICD